MENNGHIVMIICAIELRDVEQTFAAQAVSKITGIERRPAVDSQLSCFSIRSRAYDIRLFFGLVSCRGQNKDPEQEEKEGEYPMTWCHREKKD